MYVDTERATGSVALHLLREELTQSLGIGRDSDTYNDSIFRSAFSATTDYASIDRDVIRLLYHPGMPVGIGDPEVSNVLSTILAAEKEAG